MPNNTYAHIYECYFWSIWYTSQLTPSVVNADDCNTVALNEPPGERCSSERCSYEILSESRIRIR